jgi:putative ABC transport system permease protein
MRAFGRLKPDADLKKGNLDLSVVAARLQQQYPTDYPATQGLGATMDGLQDQLTHQVRPMLLILLGTAGLVLLIACANVANLALARMMRREQEMAV